MNRVAILLVAVVAALSGGQWLAHAQLGPTQVQIGDRINPGAAALVTHSNALAVTCFTNAGVAETCGGSGGGGDAVNVFHQSTIAHISSVTHMAAADGGFVIRDPINTGARARVDHTGALVTSATVSVTTDNVNVFHQSTIRHVSSVTHMAAADGGFVIRDPINAGARARVDHTGALVTSASVTTTVDNINVFHQSTVRHISSITHVGGGIMIRDPLCLTCNALVDHTGALRTSATVTTTVDNVNVFHQSTVRHISSVTHVGGGIMIRDPLCATCNARVDHTGALVTSATVTTDNVNVFHQSTIRHISSVTHVIAANSNNHVEGGFGPYCHTTLAVHVGAGFTQIIHLTSSNNGIDQSGWFVYFCSVLLVSSHAANSITLVEGVGTTCQSGIRPLIGSIRLDDTMHMTASGGFAMTAPTPFMGSQLPGNNICVGQSSRGTSPVVSGMISYRAGPAGRP